MSHNQGAICDITAIQETHIDNDDITEIKTSDNKKSYTLYHVGEENNKYHGVGIVIDNSINGQFKKINNRTCKFTTKLEVGKNKTRDLVFIATYAPTLEKSQKNPELRTEYYTDLENEINNIPQRSFLVIGGDFNAKTGSGWKDYPNNMGKYGKGEINDNGEHLLDMARRTNLVLSNTLFYHKMAHRTTWECPMRINEFKDRNGMPRKNPYRNQIDYILLKKEHRILIQNARSYSGIITDTDHRLVISNIKFLWYKTYKKTEDSIDYQVQQLKQEKYKEAYKKSAEEIYKEIRTSDQVTAQDQWNAITQACHKAAKETLEKTKPGKQTENPEIAVLSKKQKKIRNDINATKDQNKNRELRKERNIILKKIHDLVQEDKVKVIEDKVKEIEQNKNDSTRMYQAVRQLKQSKPKKKLVVNGENGITTSEIEQVNIITKHFKEVFQSAAAQEIPIIHPKEMRTPFTAEEVKKAANSLKNNKSAGCDQLKAEQIKYGPEIIHKGIAELLNTIAITGEYPEELKTGILVPLPKPGKQQGPPKNLRPIILLSMIRKILAIIMIRRTIKKIDNEIPLTQAAYRSGRGTTEHVFTIKTLAEKAITSNNYEIYILLLDMSKAFDTVDRKMLIEDLKKILDEDEIHMFYMLLKDVKIQVKVGKEKGEKIITNTGVPQGDCASAILFTLYLANSLKKEESIRNDHNYSKKETSYKNILPEHLLDHSYSKELEYINIDQQYADDITWITTNTGVTSNIKKVIPEKLKERNLQINKDKTEEYKIKKDSDDWKKCRYLGSLLGTEEDIKKRKGLAIDAYNQLKNFLDHKKTSIQLKMRIFQAYICSIFLYNSELWTLTKNLEKEIDVFQRILLRRIINKTKMDKVRNTDLYFITKTEPWSRTVKRRRLNWIGHLMRLPKETPARQALAEQQRKTSRPRGRPKMTWINKVEKDLKEIDSNITFDLLQSDLTTDRKSWRRWVARAMAS